MWDILEDDCLNLSRNSMQRKIKAERTVLIRRYLSCVYDTLFEIHIQCKYK